MGMSKADSAKALKQYKEDFGLSSRLDDSRDRYKMQKRFIYLDEQWEPQAKARRKKEERPIVTINTSRQFIQQVANTVRKNPPSIQVIPTGDGAEIQEAQIREEIVRGIQEQSNGDECFIHGIEDAAAGGFGIVKLEPEYESDDSFVQVLKLKRVLDASTCRIDPRAREPDFSDQRFFIEQIPYSANQIGSLVGAEDAKEIRDKIKELDGKSQEMWGNKKSCNLINHWRVELKADTLYDMQDGTTAFESDSVDLELTKKDARGKPLSRPTYKRVVYWRRLMGEKLLSEVKWPGATIPVGVFAGQHIVVEDTMQFVSLTAPLIDTQRIRNFARANQVELMATSPKARFKASLGSIPEEMRPMWENAHKENWRVLYYQEFDEQQRKLTAPEEIQPIGPDAQLTQEIAITDAEAHQVTGRYEAAQGAANNATSGKQEGMRKEYGETSTVHFEHNGSVAMKYLGNCILEVMPYYYDTPRRVLAVASDGSRRMATINREDTGQDGKPTNHQITENKFSCVIKIGPSYATKLLQSMDTMQSILQAIPEAGQARPDLVVKAMGDAMGWNQTQEWVESLKALIPPQVQAHLDQVKEQDGQAPPIPPQIQAQMQQMTQQLQAVAPEMARLKNDNELEWAKLALDVDKAKTERIKVLADHGITIQQAIIDANTEIEKEHIKAAAGHSGNMMQAHQQLMQQQTRPQEEAQE